MKRFLLTGSRVMLWIWMVMLLAYQIAVIYAILWLNNPHLREVDRAADQYNPVWLILATLCLLAGFILYLLMQNHRKLAPWAMGLACLGALLFCILVFDLGRAFPLRADGNGGFYGLDGTVKLYWRHMILPILIPVFMIPALSWRKEDLPEKKRKRKITAKPKRG
ncbi:MAG: hypothetical protein FWF49_06180 [Oscillospiraceae bacterium]|nr:hypothetical protein [Oscillospiraceae bacterium]